MLNPNMKLSGRKIVKKVLKQKPTLVEKGHPFGISNRHQVKDLIETNLMVYLLAPK